ncbi:VWA domain-containing protein [Fodinicurvata sp. EGI_FJ10296]|uniref:VWA domain-containing protein n=1 Tax=Fodinicurvata sp. EGI_FJ10296 TaxID=3231908 RepID=UPI003452B11A
MAEKRNDSITRTGNGPVQGTSSGAVDAFLAAVKATPKKAGDGNTGRLIFAMDATASREPTWDRACHLQAEMFEATRDRGGLAVQLVFFRGFGECKSSHWMSDGSGLRDAMLKVRCHAGLTQIDRVLKHAVAESGRQKVNALVYVGDSFEDDIDKVGQTAGQLGLNGVPAFMFHEGGDPVAAKSFKEVARLTGGAYCPFDTGSADTLRRLLGAVASFAAGGWAALEDYGHSTGTDVPRLIHRGHGASPGAGRKGS